MEAHLEAGFPGGFSAAMQKSLAESQHEVDRIMTHGWRVQEDRELTEGANRVVCVCHLRRLLPRPSRRGPCSFAFRMSSRPIPRLLSRTLLTLGRTLKAD
jgi:hypothetical protein